MSVAALSWVLEHSDARLADRLVLLVLADHAKSDGTGAWPGIDTIAVQARVSRRTAIYSLQALEAAGAIVKTGTSRAGTSVWTVVMAVQTSFDDAAETPQEGGADFARADSARVQNAANSGADSAPDPYREPSLTPPLTPPPGGSTEQRRSRRRNRALEGQFDPERAATTVLSDWDRAAYERLGVHLEPGATMADAIAACDSYVPPSEEPAAA